MASALVIAVLLYGVCLSGAAMAQQIDSKVTVSPQTLDQKSVFVDNALSDYLSGKTVQLTLPGVRSGDTLVFDGHVPPGFVDILPPGRSDQPVALAGNAGILSVNPRETLPYTAGFSQDYAATYIGACGVLSRTTSLLASSVYAKLSPQSLANLQLGEILVLHLWGKNVNDIQPENDIVIGRNWTKSGYVDFTIYISAYGNPWVKTISLPATHTFTIYIKTVNPKGSSYSRLEFCVYDVSTMRSYTYQYALPAAQTMDGADIALEKYYQSTEQRPGLVNKWRTITAFHVYDQYKRCVDLLQTGFVCEWLTSGVETAYYHDYKYYIGARNGEGTFSMTRYRTGGQYPPHP
jgi:hypothetical protein